MTFSTKNLAIFLTLVILTFGIEQFKIDFWIQDFFFNSKLSTWAIDAKDPFYKAVFYKGLKGGITIFGFSLLIYMFYSWQKSKKFGVQQQSYLLIFICVSMIPLIVSIFKQFTNVQCPSNLIQYGGNRIFQGLFDPPIPGQQLGKCFPAGHASIGFALMSLYFVWKGTRYKYLGLAIGFILGWVMALYQMLKGAHFLSHSLATMLLSWLFMVSLSHVFKKKV